VFRKPIIILLILLSLGLYGCKKGAGNKPPEDFSFSLRFGFEGINSINTKNGTFTKDLVSAGTETIRFIIPADKMQDIYNLFVKNKISRLPADINAFALEKMGDTASSSSPADKYTLTYTCNGETRTIICNAGGPWDARKGPPDEYKRLVEFIDYIREYIYSTQEYTNMSPAVGAYS